MKITTINNQFGISAKVKTKQGTLFFKPAAMHKLMIQTIIGEFTDKQIENAKTLVAKKFNFKRSEIL